LNININKFRIYRRPEEDEPPPEEREPPPLELPPEYDPPLELPEEPEEYEPLLLPLLLLL